MTTKTVDRTVLQTAAVLTTLGDNIDSWWEVNELHHWLGWHNPDLFRDTTLEGLEALLTRMNAAGTVETSELVDDPRAMTVGPTELGARTAALLNP
jgi:hypothetical protein